MKENGFEYVDLGFPSKTMWATCNVGATKPEDEGLLFQFGRVDGYKYGDKNHKFRLYEQNIKDTGNEEMPATSSGKIYTANEILDLADDAAHVNMGGAWKMPTEEQLKELCNNTTHEVETINEVHGVMFTSNINGHQVFIPFAGLYYNGSYYKSYIDVSMWSSQVLASDINGAYRFFCNLSGFVGVLDCTYRSAAFSVRGVFKK